MTFSTNPHFDDHEQVVLLSDPGCGLVGFIAIHSTALGPAAGGCRMVRYASPDAALSDALRLSRGMSYKNALAGLPAGGGKATLFAAPEGVPREALFEAFAAEVDQLGGRYVTAEDVGTSVRDMEHVARRTRFVAGIPSRAGLAGGDPSPWTALGVFVALETCVGRPLAGARVAVQGLGSVGMKLCAHLRAAGARLVVADVDGNRVAAAQRDFGAEPVAVDRIHAQDADVFSPNALGGGLNAETIAELGAPMVCGAANNQLATPDDGIHLLAAGVTYLPDYVVNAGGIINVMAEYLGEPGDAVESRVRNIGGRAARILERARAEGVSPSLVADRIARELLGERSGTVAA